MSQAGNAEAIVYWNRAAGREETEKVYGDALVRWIYGSAPGQKLADWVLSRAFLSRIYGSYQSSRSSRHKIDPFIRDFAVPMNEYEEARYSSFNDFFIRKFRPGARVFEGDPRRMPAFCEARYLGYESVSPEQSFPVKGEHLTAEALVGSREKAAPFEGGPMLIARLCPVDYHRFHYPDGGRTLDHFFVRGRFHSVNPLALRYRGEILATNERQVSILETEHFGKLAYIEVGALCVGRIVQSHPPERSFARGEEKGYFLFGASTVIVIGEKGAWLPDSDILEQTVRGRETLIRLGEGIAGRNSVGRR